MLLLETVEESETSVSDDPEQLQPEHSEGVAVLWVEAREESREDIKDCAREESREDARDEALDGAGLADARLLLLTIRTLLRLLLRLSSTTSTDGGSIAFGMILDMYVASGETYITGLDEELPEVVIQGTASELGLCRSKDCGNRCCSRLRSLSSVTASGQFMFRWCIIAPSGTEAMDTLSRVGMTVEMLTPPLDS